MIDPFRRRPIGKTSLSVTQLGMGGASLGDMRESLPEAQAAATIEAAHAAGIGYFDTSPWYGNGKSELRLGHVLRTKARNSFVISSKVGRVHVRPADPNAYRHPGWAGGLPFEPRFDYTREGVLKSYETSLARLGLNRLEALLIHDIDPRHQRSEQGVLARLRELDGGGYRTLAELKERGEIFAIGAGINLVGMIPRFLERYPIDFFLVAMPYTLLEQEGLDELEMCSERGIAVIIGAPYASGILARGPRPGALYRYAPAEPEVIAKAEGIAAVCARHDVPLAAAALQFPLGHSSVVSVIPGPVTVKEVRTNKALMRRDIPDALWAELKAERLIRADAPTPRRPL
jgi:D-threo-aldose 1-dehydrogenase